MEVKVSGFKSLRVFVTHVKDFISSATDEVMEQNVCLNCNPYLVGI